MSKTTLSGLFSAPVLRRSLLGLALAQSYPSKPGANGNIGALAVVKATGISLDQ